MPRKTIEIVRAAYEAGNRRDREALLALFDPRAEIHVVGVVMDQRRVHRGHEEIWEYITSFDHEFADLRVEPEDFVDAGDSVVVSVHVHGRGRASGATVDYRFASVVTVKDGKILRGENYLEMDEALEAAGLEE
jgi:uncharacterized protein